LYETPTGYHWNVFVGDCGLESLDQNNQENIYISYNVESRHFAPLRIDNNFNGKVKITNVYFLVKHSSPDTEGIFLKMSPSELIPNHNLYQEEIEQIYQLKPVGLSNIGNTCYFNSIMQCLKVFPELCSAFESDLQSISNQESITKDLSSLLSFMKENACSDILDNACGAVILKLQQRFPNKYEFGRQGDPQELFTDVLMMMNTELRTADIGYQNFETLSETVSFQEQYFKSHSTQLLTNYLKMDRQMHSKCLHTSFQAMSFLLIPFPEGQVQSISIERLVDIYMEDEKRQILTCSECGFSNPQTVEQRKISKCANILIIKLLR
jgi:ubiquitin C-terminal hydrolase